MASRTLVLYPHIKAAHHTIDRLPSACLEEAVGLALAIDLDIVDARIIALSATKPSTLFGKGKIEEIGAFITAEEIELVSVDTQLTPVQQRNLEVAWKCKVIDRTGLILEIFGERARTAEGKLQVELAALNYQKSRLVRSWTHLERQRGGLGKTGGPGESQIELDRRIIRDRIAKIKRQLETVVRTRGLHRKTRREAPFSLIALVGYTNAGKSTLFNRLTSADALAADALFATLDPTIRKLNLASGQTVMLSDTVGFISNLPTDLIAAFRATLEEVREADLILHVRDISHPDTAAQKSDVESVLKQLLKDEPPESLAPIIEVYNKIDLLEGSTPTAGGLGISALTGEGLDTLTALLEKELARLGSRLCHYAIPCAAGKAIAWLHRNGQVESSWEEEGVLHIKVRISSTNAERFAAQFGYIA